ncbi:MAG: hypothetical protein SangKO_067460 [Sandaracinaceae bacterium]
MSGVPFHSTRMGQRYYEHTLPELVRQLTRLNDLLEKALTNEVNSPAEPNPEKPETDS